MELGRSVLFAAIAGIGGTGLGGLLGALGGRSKYLLGAAMAFTAGLMTSVVCFELIPEAASLCTLPYLGAGLLAGGMTVYLAALPGRGKDGWQRAGWTVFFAIMLHNFPEGLAIGSGWAAYPALGIRLAVTIALHDLPEGMAVALPMHCGQNDGKSSIARCTFLAALSGVPTALGALLGMAIGSLSPLWVGLSLGFAGGAMLYVCAGEIFPRLYEQPARHAVLWQALGFAVGLYLALA
ncbi:MAG: ZIP family metal transporter [Eubacteriales bacterium]|nr:ZIP family metal transporter [Eubacteriales bacterium]